MGYRRRGPRFAAFLLASSLIFDPILASAAACHEWLQPAGQVIIQPPLEMTAEAFALRPVWHLRVGNWIGGFWIGTSDFWDRLADRLSPFPAGPRIPVPRDRRDLISSGMESWQPQAMHLDGENDSGNSSAEPSSRVVQDQVELIPGLMVDRTDVESYVRQHRVRVKGRLPPPWLEDPFDMLDIWASTPKAESEEQTAAVLAALLDHVGRHESARYLRPWTRDALASSREGTFARIVRTFLPFLGRGEEHWLVRDDLVYPYAWSDKLTQEDFLFSLAHVDTRFKILFQDLYEVGVFADRGSHARAEATKLCKTAEQIFAALLKSYDARFTSHVNNLLSVDLQDRIIQMVIGADAYEYYRAHKLAPQLELKDRSAIPFFQRAGSARGFGASLVAALLSGVAFGEGGSGFEPTERLTRVAEGGRIEPHMAINDIPDLEADIKAAIIRRKINPKVQEPRIELLADDVVEIIGDLQWAQEALRLYPELKIRIWVNRYAVENNIWTAELNRLLDQPMFQQLRTFLQEGRFIIYEKNSPLLTPDPRFLTGFERRALETATAVLLRGTAPFETTQMINANTYYGFTLWHQATIAPLGISLEEGRGKAVFVHIPPGYAAFEYHRETRTFTTTLQIREKIRRGYFAFLVRWVRQALVTGLYGILQLWNGLRIRVAAHLLSPALAAAA